MSDAPVYASEEHPAPDSAFAGGELGHLVIGNRGHSLDAQASKTSSTISLPSAVVADANVVLPALIGGRARLVIASPHAPRCVAANAVAVEIARHIPRLAKQRRLDPVLLFAALQVIPIDWKPAGDYDDQRQKAERRIAARDPGRLSGGQWRDLLAINTNTVLNSVIVSPVSAPLTRSRSLTGRGAMIAIARSPLAHAIPQREPPLEPGHERRVWPRERDEQLVRDRQPRQPVTRTDPHPPPQALRAQ
jgi:hypothetical protein